MSLEAIITHFLTHLRAATHKTSDMIKILKQDEDTEVRFFFLFCVLMLKNTSKRMRVGAARQTESRRGQRGVSLLRAGARSACLW